MKRAWLIASLAFVAFAAFVFYLSVDYPLMDPLGPGAGFFPRWLSLISGAVALVLFAQTWLNKNFEDPGTVLIPRGKAARDILLVMLGMTVVTFLYEPLGFTVTTLLLLIYLPLVLGARQWWVIGLFALAGSGGVFYAFYYWLKLPLPLSPFGLGILGI